MNKKPPKYSLKEQVGYLFSSKVIALGIQFLIPIVLVRLLAKEEYGIYLQFLLVGQFLGTILVFSIPASLFFFYPNAKEKLNQLISQTFYSIIFICLLFLPLYYLFGNQLLSVLFDKNIVDYIYFPCGIYVFVFTVSLLCEKLFIVEQKSNYVVRYNLVFTLSRVSLLIISFILFKTIIAMFWALILLYLGISLFLFFYIRKNYNINLKTKRWNVTYFLSQIKYSYPLALANIFSNIGKKADRFILSAFFSSSDFAVYSIANYKVPIVNLLFPSISNVIVPQISKKREEGNIEEVKRLWHKMIIVLGTVTIPTIIYFFVIAKPLITFLYTDQYISAVNIYRIVLLSMFALILRGTTILMAYGNTKFIFYTQVVYMIFSVGIGYFLIKNFGLFGAAFTLVFLVLMRELAYIYKSKLILNLNLSDWMPWGKLSRIVLCSLVPVPLIFLLLYTEFPKLLLIVTTFICYSGMLILIYNKLKIVDLTLVMEKVRYFVSMKKRMWRKG